MADVLSTERRRPGPAAAAATIEEISATERFAALRVEWDALLERSASDSIFLTWEWLHTWWLHLGDRRHLRLLAVRDGAGELIGLLPLAVSPRGLTRLSPFWSLEFLGRGSAGSDYLDAIVARGSEEEVLPLLARHLAGQPLALGLDQVRRGESVAALLAARLARRGWLAEERPVDVCPLIPLAGHTWSSYLGSLEGSHRQNVRRRLAKLGTTFDMQVTCAATETERREALSALFDLHAKRWQGRGGTTALHSPALLDFHREWSRLALARGWLRLLVMRLDGRPVAALYCLRRGPIWSFYQTGFDPEYARHGVGQVLIGLSIKQAIEEGALVYDLLHGNERYKLDWARQHRDLGRIELYPPTWQGRLHRGLALMERGAKDVVRAFLPSGAAPRPAAGDGVARGAGPGG